MTVTHSPLSHIPSPLWTSDTNIHWIGFYTYMINFQPTCLPSTNFEQTSMTIIIEEIKKQDLIQVTLAVTQE